MPGFDSIITDEAASDIAGARQWCQKKAGLGTAFVDRIEKRLKFIEAHPMALSFCYANEKKPKKPHETGRIRV